jgi:hypothetical protein
METEQLTAVWPVEIHEKIREEIKNFLESNEN